MKKYKVYDRDTGEMVILQDAKDYVIGEIIEYRIGSYLHECQIFEILQ